MTRATVLALALLGCNPGADAPPTEPPLLVQQDPALGMNLGVPEFRGDAFFVDAVRNAPGFRSASTWELVDTDEQGYPLQVDGEPVLLELFGEQGAPHFPSGVYTLLYRGTGEITVDAPGVQLGEPTSLPDGSTRVEVTLDPGSFPLESDAFVLITRSDAGDPVRDVHFVLPGFEDAWREAPFNPDVLEKWTHYGVLRPLHPTAFWDFPDSELQPDVDWSDRMQPGDVRHGARWSYEAMIDLSNALDADLWLAVPHTATLAYTSSLAELVHERLEPERRVYIEFANECWNSYSNTNVYAIEQGVAADLYPEDAEEPSDYEAGVRWCAVQTVEHTNRFRDVFAAHGDGDRVTRVMGGFVSVDWLYQRTTDDGELGGALHETRTSTGRPVHQDVDAVAIATYFGGELGLEEVADATSTWTVDEAFAYFETGALPAGTEPNDELEGGLPGLMERIEVWKDVADGLQLSLLAYEGGPHFVADANPAVSSLYYRVLQDPRMEELMVQHLEGARDRGVDVHVLFNSAEPLTEDMPWSRFGFVEHGLCDTDDQWRWRGVERYLEQRR